MSKHAPRKPRLPYGHRPDDDTGTEKYLAAKGYRCSGAGGQSDNNNVVPHTLLSPKQKRTWPQKDRTRIGRWLSKQHVLLPTLPSPLDETIFIHIFHVIRRRMCARKIFCKRTYPVGERDMCHSTVASSVSQCLRYHLRTFGDNCIELPASSTTFISKGGKHLFDSSDIGKQSGSPQCLIML